MTSWYNISLYFLMKSKTGTAKLLLSLFSIFFCSHVLSLPLFPPSPASNASCASVKFLFLSTFTYRAVNNTSGKLFSSIKDTTRKKDRDGDGIADSTDKCPDE